MSTNRLETLQVSQDYRLDDGDVIRWIVFDTYYYAAIKTPRGWYTTAMTDNGFVDMKMDYEELVETLSRSDVSCIEIATTWAPAATKEQN